MKISVKLSVVFTLLLFFSPVVGQTKVTQSTNFQTWKTIKIGTGLQSPSQFSEALKNGDFQVGNWANDILNQAAFQPSPEETSVELVLVTLTDLGFKDGAVRKDIYQRALGLGLELCPAEVGPQLRLQYKEQPKGEWLAIGMEPIVSDTYHGLYLFDVVHDSDGLWLYGWFGHPNHFWQNKVRWIFTRRK